MFNPSQYALSEIKVFANPMLPEYEWTPVKRLKKKRWMSDSYHHRINKKWLKRFGTEKTYPTFSDGIYIFTHPANVARIEEALAQL